MIEKKIVFLADFKGKQGHSMSTNFVASCEHFLFRDGNSENPVIHAFAALIEARQKGSNIVLYSERPNEYEPEVRKFLEDSGYNPDFLNLTTTGRYEGTTVYPLVGTEILTSRLEGDFVTIGHGIEDQALSLSFNRFSRNIVHLDTAIPNHLERVHAMALALYI